MESSEDSYNQLDAIALGIEAQYDPLLVYSRRIIQRTKTIAQEIGINGSIIKLWEENKRKNIEDCIMVINRATQTK